MKAIIPMLILFLGACLVASPAECHAESVGLAAIASSAPSAGPTEKDLRVWREFVDTLRSGPFPNEKVEPYSEDLRGPLLGFLGTMRDKADWKEFQRDPEVFRVGDEVHFLIPLTFDGETATYCFSFTTKGGPWRFEHLEAVTLRLDKIGPLPATKFPDAPEDVKAWMREEFQVSRDVWLYNTLAAEKGRDAALEWFKDGAGYALAARVWVPFVDPSRAFILYLCWEQANMHGGEVSLNQLDDDRAELRLRPLYFELYERAGHLKQQIQLPDYRRLFEFRWQDRAASAGWKLDISYEGKDCVFRFSKRRE